MQPQSDPWNSLEVVKLLVGILTPLSVAAFGWFVSRRLKRLELAQWSNQKLIEKRLSVYDLIAPLLNKLLCFYTWVGYWKDISPGDVVKAKRELDQTINIYRHLFDEEVYTAYQSFIHVLFKTYTGPGHDARIRSLIQGPDGNRTTDCTYKWDEAWTQRFSTGDVVEKREVRAQYGQLMESLRKSLGVHK
ncbi:MAG: hypothetical protein NTNFB02_23900 [Nitrospira sp.]